MDFKINFKQETSQINQSDKFLNRGQSSQISNETVIQVPNLTQIANTLLSNQKSNQANNDDYLKISWKWITIDPERFKNISLPCLTRENDGRQYLSVRILKRMILTHYDIKMYPEIEQFDKLENYPSTSNEVLLLNDINLNHVDKIYGEEPFIEGKDNLVELEQFFRFYSTMKRTAKLKNTTFQPNVFQENRQNHQQLQNVNQVQYIAPSIGYPNLSSNLERSILNSNYYSTNFQIHPQNNYINQPYINQTNVNYHYVSRMQSPINIDNQLNHSIQTYKSISVQQNIYNNNISFNHQGSLLNLNRNITNNLHPIRPYFPPPISQIYPNVQSNNPVHNQVHQMTSLRPKIVLRPAINQTVQHNRTEVFSNLINFNSQNNYPSQNIPLNPSSTTYINQISTVKSDSNQSINEITKVNVSNSENLSTNTNSIFASNLSTGKTNDCFNELAPIVNANINNENINNEDNDIILIEENEKEENEIEIDIEKKNYGFLQLNNFILLYVKLEDNFFLLNRKCQKCHIYVIAQHLIDTGLITELDLKKYLTIVDYDSANYDDLNKLIKWFNKKHSNICNKQLSLLKKPTFYKQEHNNQQLVDKSNSIELVNINEFQFVYTKINSMFLKDLYYFNYENIKYYESFEEVLKKSGGLIDINRKILPFYYYNSKILVSSSLKGLLIQPEFKKIALNNEFVKFDVEKDLETINLIKEFYHLNLFYLSLIVEPKNIKNETVFIDITKWLNIYPNSFRILCVYNDCTFPNSYRKELDSFINSLYAPSVTDSVSLSPQSNDSSMINENILSPPIEETEIEENKTENVPPEKVISISILNQNKEDIEFKDSEIKIQVRQRSYSLSNVETISGLKIFGKYEKLRKKLMKNEIDFNLKTKSCLLMRSKSESCLSSLDKKKKLSKEDLTTIKIKIKKEPVISEKNISIANKSKILSNVTLSNCNKNEVSKKSIYKHETPNKKSISSNSAKKSTSKIKNNMSSTLSKKKSNTKRKFEKFEVSPGLKRRKLFKDYFDENFVVSDDEIVPLSENDEPFNFNHKKQIPKNIQTLKQQNGDLYESEGFDNDYYLRKFNITKFCRVTLKRFELKDYNEYLKKMSEKESAKKNSNLDKNRKSNKNNFNSTTKKRGRKKSKRN